MCNRCFLNISSLSRFSNLQLIKIVKYFLETKSVTATQREPKNKVEMKDQVPVGTTIQKIIKIGVKLVVLGKDIKSIVTEKSQLERLKKFKLAAG